LNLIHWNLFVICNLGFGICRQSSLMTSTRHKWLRIFLA
jgi:hypothetical protein